ncbi:MAG: YkgJ family cysteine cluster protein [Candidatus Atabeyarchaeum deiterrae]
MSDSKESQRQDNFFDVCGQCKASCCKDARPPVSSTRRKTIEDYLKSHRLKEVDPPYFNDEHGYTHPRETFDGFCTFYDKNTKLCRIHQVKPETCVAGPITFDINPKTKRLEYYLKLETICSLASKMYKTRNENDVLRKHRISAKKEIRRLIVDLDQNALKNILKIEEPETFRIEEEEIEEAKKKKLASAKT